MTNLAERIKADQDTLLLEVRAAHEALQQSAADNQYCIDRRRYALQQAREGGIGVSRLARELGIDRVTVHKLITKAPVVEEP